MYVNGGTVTIVNSIIRDNSVGVWGGVYVAGGTANVYGTTFSSNTDSNGDGPDIYNAGGTVTLYGCASGYYGGTRGAALDNSGIIDGPPYSFSGCTACTR